MRVVAIRGSAAQSFVGRSLKLRHLRLLLALDELGTITGAASVIGISQVAASKALAELEAGINAKLFERLRGGLQPTEACLRLLESGRRIIGEIKVLGEEFMMLDQGLKGRVRIGIQTQTSQPFLARTTVAFKRAYPLITVEFVSASMLDLANELSRSELQFVIGQHSLAGLHPSLMSQEIPSEPIVVVRGAQSGTPHQDVTTLAELMDYPWCLPPRGTPLRLHLDHILAAQQLVAPRVLVEMSGTMLAEAIIHLSDFVALMPHSVAQEWAARGLVRVFSVEVPPLPDAINLIWSEQTRMSQVAKLFLTFVRKQLAGGEAAEGTGATTSAPLANRTRHLQGRV
jgi:LysR family transcriptional regulator, pca operon transcriptional activator